MAASSVAEHRRLVDDLSTLAFRDVNAVLLSLGDSNPVLVRDTLLEVLPEVVGPYLAASGELAATWYEDLRAEAIGGTYYATASGAVNRERMDALVRWGVKPLFGQSQSTVLSLVGGGVQRLVAGASRNTIEDNARIDVASTSWERVARPDACPFCRMLAGRGAVYRSESAAGMVIGRGVDPSETAGKRGGQGRGVKARGARSVGSTKFHDFCRCVAKPTFYTVGSWTNPQTGRSEKALVPVS